MTQILSVPTGWFPQGLVLSLIWNQFQKSLVPNQILETCKQALGAEYQPFQPVSLKKGQQFSTLLKVGVNCYKLIGCSNNNYQNCISYKLWNY